MTSRQLSNTYLLRYGHSYACATILKLLRPRVDSFVNMLGVRIAVVRGQGYVPEADWIEYEPRCGCRVHAWG